MYEETKKYAMWGQNKVEIEPDRFDGGNYKFDQAFIDGPAVFRDFAKKLWNRNIIHTWGE